MTECGSQLFDRNQELHCERNPRHYTKPHRAVGSWMTDDGQLVGATVTWPASDTEWDDVEEER